MTTVRTAAALGVLVMAAAIAYGFTAGSFTADGAALLDLVWGQVTMIDLYVAFLVVWGWIAWREASPARAAGWLVLVVTLGSLAIATYLLLAALRARSVPDLLVGPRGAERRRADRPSAPRSGGTVNRSVASTASHPPPTT